jgi:hypothetical protein
VLIDFSPKKYHVQQSRKRSATISTSDVDPGSPSGPVDFVFCAMQSHDLLQLRALFLCARFATGCERRFFSGFPVHHFQHVNGALVENFPAIAKHAYRCGEFARDLPHRIGFCFVVAK